MTVLNLEELTAMLVENAGADDHDVLDGDIADRDFDDLGYDSLARLELAAEIKRRYGIELPDDLVTDLRTPGAVVDAVNEAALQGQSS